MSKGASADADRTTRQGPSRKASRPSRASIPSARADGWCWPRNDPEQTYPDEREWLSEHLSYEGYGILAKPFVREFQWGVPAPSTFVVAYEDSDESPELAVFDSRDEAEAFAQKIAAQAIEAGTAETEGLDSKHESAVGPQADAPDHMTRRTHSHE